MINKKEIPSISDRLIGRENSTIRQSTQEEYIYRGNIKMPSSMLLPKAGGTDKCRPSAIRKKNNPDYGNEM